MTDTPDYEPMFAALCAELGICLHAKGQTRVVAALPSGLDAAVKANTALTALPSGLDAAVKAVFAAEGIDSLGASGDLKRQVRDCLKANLPAG